MKTKKSFSGVTRVRAEASETPANAEITKIIGEIKTAHEAFKAENDEAIKDLKAGMDDVVRSEKIDTINAEITKLQANLEEMVKKYSAVETGATASTADLEIAAQMSQQMGSDFSASDVQEYRAAMNTWMRRGNATPQAVMAAMSVGSDPDGGYTVLPDMSGRIVKKVYETSPIRSVASTVTISTDRLEGSTDLDEASAGWVAETGTRSDTDTPQLGQWEIPVHEIYAQPKATQKLLDDSAVNIENWLADKVADKFMRTENTAFVSGNGVGKPRGFLTYTTAATADSSRAWGVMEHVNTGTNGGFGTAPNGSDKLIDLVFKSKPEYRQNANWMMSRATLADVRKLKDGDGNYLWQPDFGQRVGGVLLGYPIVEADDMPTIATGSLSIAFGDFAEAYTIVDRMGIRVLRDPFTAKPYVRFYTTKRVGGDVINFEALKFLRFSA